MKIRKLIFKAKLEQIEKTSQTIFLFHCSASAAHWRFLKNFLYNQTKLFEDSGSKKSQSKTAVTKHLVNSNFKGFTFFQSTSGKKKLRSNFQIPNQNNFANLSITLYEPKGSLVFFQFQSQNPIEVHEKNYSSLKLINNLDSSNEELLLLYGKLNSKQFNYCDLNSSLQLNAESVYHDFFCTLHLVNRNLQNCLHHNINDFLSSQEMRNVV
jgi:hypothetical protein